MPDPIGVNANGTDKTKTEAPTSGVTISAAEKAVTLGHQLTEEQFDFVNLVHQHYNVHGTLLTSDKAAEVYEFQVTDFAALFTSPAVKQALTERNVPLSPVLTEANQTWRNHALSAIQIIVADTMLDINNRKSNAKKLQDLGVKTSQWNAWLKEPAFAKYLDDNMQAVLKHGQHDAAMALMDRVGAGDLAAIKYYHEYTGRFVSNANSTTGNVNSELINANNIIASLVEIIVEEIEDPLTAARIADRIRQLTSKTQIITGLHASEVQSRPMVAKSRELTPAMQVNIANGVGMET